MPCKNAPLSSESARRPVPSGHNPSKKTQLGKTKKEELKMKEYLKTYLEQAKVGDLQTFANLSMIPLVSTYKDDLDYMLLDEALEKDLITITELDDNGSVPELKVLNRSEGMVLILDGEELVGAKQNRIVNTTILLASASKTVIPVSCVEQGRWSQTTEAFKTEKRMSPSFMRRNKSEQVFFCLKETKQFRSDQGALWDEISVRQARAGVRSRTGEMAAIYRSKKDNLKAYIDKIKAVNEQTGAIFLINGKVAGLEAFGRHEILAKVFPKLVESYAVDAMDCDSRDNQERIAMDQV
ncbi:MAG: hypothetical protein DSZ23_01885, partial [Thermodesulfatator sp.]